MTNTKAGNREQGTGNGGGFRLKGREVGAEFVAGEVKRRAACQSAMGARSGRAAKSPAAT